MAVPIFLLLQDRPEFAPVVARWWFDEWGHESPGLTYEASLARVEAGIDEVLPVTVIAVDGDAPIGVAELKSHELYGTFPMLTPWLGGVFVAPDARGHGLAAALVREVERIASGAGFRRLYLETEDLEGGLYARLGWQAHARHEEGDLQRLVMERQLDAR